MNTVLCGLLYEQGVISFIDDILVFGKDFDEFLHRLKLVFDRLMVILFIVK